MSKPLKAPFRTLTVFCACGEKLLRYRKKGKGRLVKIHKLRIAKDYTGIFSKELPEGENIVCPNCEKRVATVRKINGKWVFKLNQGQIGMIRK